MGRFRASHPDFRYQLLGEPEVVGNGGRVRWITGPPGAPPAAAGATFMVAREGRVAAIYLFFDPLPAAPARGDATNGEPNVLVDVAYQLPPVVVRAARLPPAAGDAAFSIIRIDPRALATNERLDTALATAPGFSLYRRTSSLGANPTTQGVSLRGIAGSGASRGLVTLDGVPENDPFGGWVIWTGLPAEAVGGASIVRGAGARPYGAASPDGRGRAGDTGPG